MSDLPVFAVRLRQARLKLKLSQKALGIAAGIDEFSASPRMNQYERGKHMPDLLTFERLAETLGVPIAYFFAVEDEMAELLTLWGQIGKRARTALVSSARDLVPPQV